MPYYVYSIKPGVTDLVKGLEKISEFETFKQAKTFVKDKRNEQDDASPVAYKIIFADNPLEAEERLSEQREAPILREWEK
ncbi:MAG: hypothetical protein HKM94_04855 [Halobacteria archaeon]|nr:hypothetical protein [Halobacteria archaeon]